MTTASAERFALRLHKVSKAFGGVQALNKVDFEVRAGEVHCLAGENGCGKSTLIKVVTGVHRPESAELIELFGQRIDRITPVQARELGVSVIWQDLALFPHMSVADNLDYASRYGARASDRPRIIVSIGNPASRSAPISSTSWVSIAPR